MNGPPKLKLVDIQITFDGEPIAPLLRGDPDNHVPEWVAPEDHNNVTVAQQEAMVDEALALLVEAEEILTQAQPGRDRADGWLDRIIVIEKIRREFEEWF